MISSFSDLVLKITAHDPDTVENDLNNGVEIPREPAVFVLLCSRIGIGGKAEHAARFRKDATVPARRGYRSCFVAAAP